MLSPYDLSCWWDTTILKSKLYTQDLFYEFLGIQCISIGVIIMVPAEEIRCIFDDI